MKKTVPAMIAGSVITVGAIFGGFAVAAAQTDESELCDLVTPAVRDVVQDAPLIQSILNLDPALPNDRIDENRRTLGCAVPGPQQTRAEARAEVCDTLTEARIEDLVMELNNPDATTALDTVRPGLKQILVQARDQMDCDPATVTPTPTREKDGPAPTVAPREKDGPAPQVREVPKRAGVNTGEL